MTNATRFIAAVRERLKAIGKNSWQIHGQDKHWRENYAYIKIRGSVPGYRWPVADVRFLDYPEGNDFREANEIAHLIVSAPTDLTKLTDALDRALAALKRISEDNSNYYASSESTMARMDIEEILK